jgi:hypothetical protein
VGTVRWTYRWKVVARARFVLEMPLAAEVLFGAPQDMSRLAHPAEVPVALVRMPSFVHSEAPERSLEELVEDRASANIRGRKKLSLQA